MVEVPGGASEGDVLTALVVFVFVFVITDCVRGQSLGPWLRRG